MANGSVAWYSLALGAPLYRKLRTSKLVSPMYKFPAGAKSSALGTLCWVVKLWALLNGECGGPQKRASDCENVRQMFVSYSLFTDGQLRYGKRQSKIP